MIRNILVYGIGGVGGYFGGRLAHYYRDSRDIRVSFAARGAHLKEIAMNGLLLKAGKDSLICRPYSASDDITKLPVPDMVLVCVKAYSLSDAVRDITGVCKDKTLIMPLLNGVDIAERIRLVLKCGILLPSCVYVGSHIESPGVVVQNGAPGKILSGCEKGRPLYRGSSELSGLFGAAGIDFGFFSDPYPSIWEKYLFTSSFALVTAYSGKTIGEVYKDPENLGLVRKILEETLAIAAAKGIGLSGDIIGETIEKANLFTDDVKTSYQRDRESGGENEGDIFGNAIIRMGRELNIPTPVTEKLSFRIQGISGSSQERR
jgi:2-dehydropantoate 2-reductase